MESNKGISVLPNSLKRYSVLGGITGYIFLMIKLSLSSSRNCWASILSVIAGIFFSNLVIPQCVVAKVIQDYGFIFASNFRDCCVNRTIIFILHFIFYTFFLVSILQKSTFLPFLYRIHYNQIV